MANIYDGSFVLGNTNELTFSAGPGIKIDSPSAGTVRIGNDETVLWEDWTKNDQVAGTMYILSESWKNFERIGLTYDNMEFTGRLNYVEYPTSGAIELVTPMTNYNTFPSVNIPWAHFKTSGDNLTMLKRGLVYGSWTSPNFTSGDFRGNRLHKIIGLNRISGNA